MLKKLMLKNFFDKEKYLIHYESLKLYLRLGLKLKKKHALLEFNQLQGLKQYVRFNKNKKRTEAEKNVGKDGKDLYRLMKKQWKTQEIEVM